LDRIDIHIKVLRENYEKLINNRVGRQVNRFAKGYKQPGIFNDLDLRIPIPKDSVSFATPI